MILKIGTGRQELKENTVYIQDDPKLTLTIYDKVRFSQIPIFAYTRSIRPRSVYRPIGPLVYM